MNIEKMREEFEAWAITSAWLGIGDESQLHQDAKGTGYNEIEVHTAWLAWQASRSAIEIVLPEGKSLMERMYGPQAGGPDRLIHHREARMAIEAAGLKVKP